MKDHLARIIDKYAKLILLVILAITLSMVPGLKKIKVVSQPPENGFTNPNEFVKSVMDVKKAFGENSRIFLVAIEAQGGHTLLEPDAIKIMNTVTSRLKTLPLIRRDTVMSMSTMSEVENSADGMTSVPYFKKIPDNFFELASLEEKIKKNEFIFGRLISKDFKTTMVVASARTDMSLYLAHDEIATALKDVLTTKETRTTAPFLVTIAGEPEVAYQLETNVQKDAVVFLGIAMLLIIGSFYFMFNTWKGVILLIAAMTVGIAWTMGAIGYYGEPISILSAMLPVVIVVIGSSYAIHVFHGILDAEKETKSFRKAYVAVLNKILAPLTMSTSMTIVGGLSLLSFKLKMIEHFGMFTSLGTFFTYIISIVMIPALYHALAGRIRKIENTLETAVTTVGKDALTFTYAAAEMIPIAGPVARAVTDTARASIEGGVKGFVKGATSGNLIERMLRYLSKIVARRPWIILGFTAGFIAFAFTQIPKVQIGFDNLALLPNGYEVKNVMLRLDKSFNGIQGFDMLVDTGESEGALEPKFLEKVVEFSNRVRKLENITYVFSLADVLMKVDSILNTDPHKKGAPEPIAKLPPSREAAAQYLFLLSSSGGGAGGSDGLITTDHRKLRMNITSRVSDTQKVEVIYNEIKAIGNEIFGTSVHTSLGGGLVANVGLLHYIVWGKIQNIMISLLLILLIIAMVYRSFERGLLSVITLPLGVIANFGLMGYVGIRLDIVTAIITSFAMGVGVDFSIHFLSALKAEYDKYGNMEKAIEHAITGPGLSIAYNAISTKIGFSALLFSRFASIHTFATLMCFNMMILALAALTFLPAVIRIVEPECVTSHRARHKIAEHRMSFAMRVILSAAVCISLVTGIIVVDHKAGGLILGFTKGTKVVQQETPRTGS